MFKGIDLSSDTVTKPSLGMKQAMIDAEVGDEQKNEDPTTKKLESMIASMANFDNALFFPSATMANQVAIWSQTSAGDAILLAENSHIYLAESGATSIHARVICYPILTKSGIFLVNDIKNIDERKAYNHPQKTLVCIENTTNMGGGKIWDINELNKIIGYCYDNGLATHLDGSRIFNACVKSNTPLSNLCQGFNTVTICLSKGMGCPVGALLLFNKDKYEKIRKLKQIMGGSMRQSGILAAAGIYAIENNIERLEIDHKNALKLAYSLRDTPFIKVINDPPETNIILFSVDEDKCCNFKNICLQNEIRFLSLGKNTFRAVTHLGIKDHDIENACKIIKMNLK